MTMLAEIQGQEIGITLGFSIRIETESGVVMFGAAQAITADGASVKFRKFWDENMHRAYGDIKTLRARPDAGALGLGKTCMVTLIR